MSFFLQYSIDSITECNLNVMQFVVKLLRFVDCLNKGDTYLLT